MQTSVQEHKLAVVIGNVQTDLFLGFVAQRFVYTLV